MQSSSAQALSPDATTLLRETPRPTRRGRVAAKAFLKRLLLFLALALMAGGLGAYGWHWWQVARYLETTDDAFLQADKVTVAPRVSGYVSDVFVRDNAKVARGALIARLDDRDYRIALRQAEAEVEKDKAQLIGFGAAITQQQAQVAGAQADVVNTAAALAFSVQEQGRYENLMRTGSGTIQRQQQADADLRERRAAHDKAVASLNAAERQVESLRALEGSARATLEVAKAKLDQARLNLSFTEIRAPIAGAVGDRALRIGQFVSPGTNLLTLVPMNRDLYLIANFKETQTGDMREGQPVTFTVDAFGGHVFSGHVDSFAPGTGSQFALLPPENATGNFTKIVQRVPVRIAIDGNDPLVARLRPGLSVEANVRVRTEEHGDLFAFAHRS
jgi:membrane fusion protein (multidrug efflux system)